MGKNSSMYREACSLLMERFPMLGLLAPTWSEKKGGDEEVAKLSIDKAEVVYFYGLGNGAAYFQCKGWLQGNEERKLIFLEDDPGFIASFLHLPEAVEILSNPQVYLELFSRKNSEIDLLAERFPVRRVEVAGLPSKKRSLQRLRLKLLRKTALSHALYLDRLHGYQPFDNFVRNVRHLPSSFYANGLKDAFKNVPAIVCGAGPSLQQSMKVLSQMENRALLIAGGSTLAALSSRGISPHFGMAVDPNLEEYRRMKNSFAFEVPLLYSTRVHPAVFQTCNGPFGYMRSGIGGVPELWIEEEMGLFDSLIGDFLSPEAISVTSICIAWAQFLGCNPILLNGVDLAYTGNRRYAAGVDGEEELAFQAIDAEKSAADRIIRRKDRQGKPIYTAVRWVMESASISHFAKKHPEIRLINTTEGGIGFKGIEYVPLAQAVRSFKKRELRKDVFAKIGAAPMPACAAKVIPKRMAELRASLLRVIDGLKIISGEKRGSAALAEMDIKEEIAFLYLFYDIYQIIKGDDHFWKNWLKLAEKYEIIMRDP
ncbi:MAG TPA: 6-hydroxymethylpterin diphosphokinase MptE-like protein [Chlamydiales bacterium]|nr:6-hydroxymethylpterin diphosphokinase MptE-like protein [Chlamydiales bacterium]